MAHFLEHLVFKGGEKYDDYRKVNETAERMGAVLNAYTSHDLVAFHITCRAEVVGEAIDLLTDFVGRPKIDAEELDRERGVVIQEIARAQRPAVGRRRAPDRPRRVRRPSARPPRARARRSTCATFTRDAIVAFRARQWAGSRGGAFLVGNLEHVPDDTRARRGVRPLPVDLAQRRLRAGAGVRAADAGRGSATPTSRTCGSPTARRSTRATARSAPRSASTRRCWAARWARACSTRSASSAASPTPSTRSTTRSPTCRSCSSRPAWSPASASRPTRGCARSSTSCATDGPREEEVERARAYAAGRRVLAFENTNAVARYAADADGRLRAGHRPRRGDRRARRASRFDQVARGRPRHLRGGSRSPASARTKSASSR